MVACILSSGIYTGYACVLYVREGELCQKISIMKYIGATDAFVNAPFFVEGIVIGLIGAVIPVAILRYIYGGVVNFVLGKFSVLQNILAFMPASEVFEVLIPVAVILGIGIGLIGSFFAVRKHADV